jgi:acetylglutamate synthase
MNAAELKLDLFRRIDGLESSKLEMVYAKIINLLGSEQIENILSPDLKKALDDALIASMNSQTYSHDDVKKLTKEKYPKLFK